MYEVRKDAAEKIKSEFVESTKKEAGERADRTRQEFGDVVVEKVGEYFPEAVQKRRRRNIASGFVLGVLVGFLVRYVVGER